MSESPFVDKVWNCRNFNVAAFLAYCLPDGCHRGTTIDARGPAFHFSDVDRCRELTNVYYGSEPIAIGDLKAFTELSKKLRSTIRAAETNGGSWERNEDE